MQRTNVSFHSGVHLDFAVMNEEVHTCLADFERGKYAPLLMYDIFKGQINQY